MFSSLQETLWSIFDKGARWFLVGLFAFLFLLPVNNIIAILFAVLYFTLLRKNTYLKEVWCKFIAQLSKHSNGVAVVILLLSTILKVGALIAFFYIMNIDRYYGDAWVFQEKIKAVEAGMWVQNKSWVTVFVYGIWAKAFSSSVLSLSIFGAIIHTVTIISAFFIGKKLFGNLGGLLLEGYVAFDIFLCAMSTNPYSENLYGLMFLFAIFFAFKMYEAEKNKSLFFFSGLCALFSWLMVWTRSDGIIFSIALTLFYVALVICSKGVAAYKKLLIYIGTLSLFAFISFCINVKVDGSRTIFCSNDNYIPRVMGVNYASKGQWDTALESEIINRYLADYPEKEKSVRHTYIFQPYPFMNELIPYCKIMIKELTESLTLSQWVELIFSKECAIFGDYGRVLNVELKVDNVILKYLEDIYRKTIVVALLLLVSISLYRLKNLTFIYYLFAIISGGACLMYAIAEANYRYGYLFFFLLAVVAASTLKTVGVQPDSK